MRSNDRGPDSTQSSHDAVRLDWARLRDAAPEWRVPRRPTLVVAPHPDDEVLGAAGLIIDQLHARVTVEVLAVTDGEAAYPGYGTRALGALRRQEQALALNDLGIGPEHTHRLGLPDGAVESREAELTGAICDRAPVGGLIVTPWAMDHHCDHEAVGRAAARAARATGSTLVSSLFWAWQYRSTDAVGAEALCKLPLARQPLEQRRRAMERHTSQVTDLLGPVVLSPADLEPLSWSAEYYLVSGELESGESH